MKKIFLIAFFAGFQIFSFAQWNTDRILTIGRNALYFEDYVLSIQYFNQVIKIKPYLAEPYMYRAIAKIQLGDFQGAELDANEAIERNPFVPQAYYVRGFALRKLDKYTGAASDFSKALEFSPNNFNLLMNRMDVLEKMEDYKGAMKDLEEYMKMSPKTYGLYYEKGRLLLTMKDTLGAESTFNQFIQMDSTNSLGWSARALLRMQKNDNDGAYKDYSKAIKLNSSYSGDYINRGIINVQKKNFRQALSDYDYAIKLDNKNDLAYYNRGLLRANLGDNNNALSDLSMVLEIDSNNIEARYRRAMLENTLGQYRFAMKDYNIILKKHNYFIPAYLGLAEAEEGLGNKREAFRYRQLANNIEKNKDNLKQKKDKLVAENKIVSDAPKSNSSRKTEMFNRFITQNIEDNQTESKYNDTKRGNVQDKFTDVINERNFALTYYAKNDEFRRTNLYHPILDQYNKSKLISSVLKITNNEIPLTSELVNRHFETINTISVKIQNDNTNADLYFYRALEFALVQDFNSSVDDLNKALSLRSDFTLAYFFRANIRYKLVDYIKSSADENAMNTNEGITDKSKFISADKQYKFDVELIMRDYDKVIELQPDFGFAYFNKANILCTQNDFRTAISYYTKAIEIDVDFAEAYFNRGLTNVFIGEDAKGTADLGKAGELGIYQSYNLIQRFGK
ncbi:MAG TPA: tetratricopeptide repeat protein [Paludibacter sp.]|nr:tetratricopeptide repeat protein [Paludibacter sp.]